VLFTLILWDLSWKEITYVRGSPTRAVLATRQRSAWLAEPTSSSTPRDMLGQFNDLPAPRCLAGNTRGRCRGWRVLVRMSARRIGYWRGQRAAFAVSAFLAAGWAQARTWRTGSTTMASVAWWPSSQDGSGRGPKMFSDAAMAITMPPIERRGCCSKLGPTQDRQAVLWGRASAHVRGALGPSCSRFPEIAADWRECRSPFPRSGFFFALLRRTRFCRLMVVASEPLTS